MQCCSNASSLSAPAIAAERINLNSGWFRQRRRYETDKKIYDFQTILFPVIAASTVFLFGAVLPKKTQLLPVDLIMLSLLAFVTGFTVFAYTVCSSKLGGLPNLNKEKQLQQLCGLIQTLSLKKFAKIYKKEKKIFKACVRYEIIPYNVFHNLKWLKKEYLAAQASAKNGPERRQQKAALKERWVLFQPEIALGLPYQIDQV